MWSGVSNYQTFLPSTTLMTPQDCKSGKNRECVKMWNKDVFRNDVSNQEWDRIQVVCRQPFAKDKQFGLQFIHLVPVDDSEKTKESPETTKSQQETIAQFKSMLSPTSRRHDKMNTSPSSGRLTLTPSRGASLVQAALNSAGGSRGEARVGKETTPIRRRSAPSKLKPTPYEVNGSTRRQMTSSRTYSDDIEDEVECFLEGCGLQNMPKHILEALTYRDLKEKMEKQRGCQLTKGERKIFLKVTTKIMNDVMKDFIDEDSEEEKPATKIPPRKNSTMEIINLDPNGESPERPFHSRPTSPQPTPTTPQPTSPQILVNGSTRERMTSSRTYSDDIEADTNDNTTVDPCDLNDAIFISCPICFNMFPQATIATHADVCAERLCSQ